MNEVKTFSKAQVSSFLGGITDYGVMLVCVGWFGSHYITGIFIGGLIGAIVNYSINRYWSFRGSYDDIRHQLTKYTLVVFGSILLKSAGTSFLTEIVHLDYRISRLLTDAFVSFGFNYTLHRFWVFKRQMVK